ncbi:Uncharacterised protein [[Flavobacterium] thermophilum]|nr:hypothetical protein GARCT_03357 [Geobacillus sp. 12AMOR1]STO36020.1 Uncharacterised protein [[Flavobacterium] thermophilum]
MEKSGLPAFLRLFAKSCACFFLNNTLFTLVRKNQHFLPILAQKTALLVKYVLR